MGREMNTTRECPYCGTTEGLRITCRNPWTDKIDDVICGECFTGQDDGPCFDDLEPVEPTPAQRARDRIEYEDPYGYERGRRW